jgi:hypothetical protein
MTDQVTIQFVKGGFIVTTFQEGKTVETEIVATPRKLQQLLKDKVEALSTTPNTDE